MSNSHRIEHDFLGEKQIPNHAYWGVHTARAVENFPISGTMISAMPDLIRAFGFVKKAAARANVELGALDGQLAQPIIKACEALIAGKFLDQFVVDVIQGGAGTSTNMNANEVIANVALEFMGLEKGRYDALRPNDHVNASQAPTTCIRPQCVLRCGWPLTAFSVRWKFCGQGLMSKRSHPVAGRGADDAGARVFDLRRDDRRRCVAAH